MTVVKQGRHRMPGRTADLPHRVELDPVQPDSVAAEETSASEAVESVADGAADGQTATPRRRRARGTILAYLVLPALALALAVGAGVLKWQASSVQSGDAADAAVRAATDGAIALLSYQPATVEQDLGSATNRLTGSFRNAYASLAMDTVIPDAKKRQISAVTTVPAAASVSVRDGHAVLLLFVNQTVIVGNGAPASTNSSVRVKLDRVGDRWLISAFDPI